MKSTAAPIRFKQTHSPITINRLSSVEEELTDRLVREKNGQRVIHFCQKLGALLIVSYSPIDDNSRELRETLCSDLISSLNCSANQATALIELALDLVHAGLYNSYRRPDVDLSFVVATAAGALTNVSSN